MSRLDPFYGDYCTRLADRLNSGEILKDLPEWIQRHTKLRGKPFSFKDHEYQLDIAREPAPEADIIKCSQVGMSELQIRLVLAYLHVARQKTAIYVMPHLDLAKKFTKSRIDPVIETSPTLKASMKTGTDSATMKQIADSFLHIGGAESPRSAISTPAQILIIDEYDFCNMRVLGMYSSRLRHAIEEMFKRRFSTPTVSNYGISRNYSLSNQKRYMCKCTHCGEWQAPEFFTQVVIPGYSRAFEEFEVEDLINSAYQVEQAYIACVKCRRELDTSLADPKRREWVAKFEHRSAVGYAVRPFDLMKTNPTVSVIMQMKEYKTTQDYYNFVHGLPLDTDENKVNEKVITNCSTGEWLEGGNGWCIGIDVGKTCHIAVGRKIGGKRVVVWLGKVKIKDGSLIRQLIELCQRFGFERICIDHGPDIEIPHGLQEKFGADVCHPVVYVKGRKGDPLWADLKEDTGYLNAARTKCIDSCVQAMNAGKWVFPKNKEVMAEVVKHLQQMVRIEEADEEGELTASWVKSTDNDHYFHALIYLHCAMELCESDIAAHLQVAPTMITGIKVGGTSSSAQAAMLANIRTGASRSSASDQDVSALAAMFGRIR